MSSKLLREGNRLYSYHLSRVQSHPPNYTTYYLTLTEPESNVTLLPIRALNESHFYSWENLPTSIRLQIFFSFKWAAWLSIRRWRWTTGWFSYLLGKDSRLYSYLTKSLKKPTTIQSTTSAPRTAFILLQQQTATKTFFFCGREKKGRDREDRFNELIF